MAMNRSFFLFLHLSKKNLLEKNNKTPHPPASKKKTHINTPTSFVFFFPPFLLVFVLFYQPPKSDPGGIFPKIAEVPWLFLWRTLVSQRSVICWSLGRLEHPDGARGMERWCNLGVGWLVGLGWVGLGWLVGKNAWCSGCFFSVEVVKLVFSQVAFMFLMFEVCFFSMFFGHLFRICWSLFFQPKKSQRRMTSNSDIKMSENFRFDIVSSVRSAWGA